ncbi:MAG: type II toxin-antitoxin system HicA family toxin [Microcystis aeruginosa LG13-11]|jgi:predicted RNA binding protein YcfA (HicA-like mRNA interferase family)|nr:type II toxin-antitoxin system HicA family toxin [Microcystis aeruginosa LG13-11]
MPPYRIIPSNEEPLLLRINGSHHIYGKPNNPARISVPIHGNQALKPGLLRHFLKVANLTDDDL